MRKNKIVFFLFMVAVFFQCQNIEAQEYKYEVGAVAGTSFYLGDANKTKLYRHPGIAAGGIFRYNINFHWALKTNLVAGTLSGNTADAKNVFPFERQTSFKRNFFDLGGQIEYNFFPFSDKFSYLDAKPYTPYIFAGVGTTLATGGNLFFNANVPIGIGFKYKVSEKLNMGLEFSMRKLFGDNLDAPQKNAEWSLDAPYGIKSSFLKNQDWYSLTLLYVTWDFGLRREPCCD